MDRTKETHQATLVCIILAAATLVSFWPVLHNGFINFDDPEYITENSHVLTGLTGENVRWAFKTGYAGNWHPLTWISHMLDVQWFGLNPAGHHFTSLVFHISNSILLFLVFRRMTRSTWRSAFVAGLFALHPLHVESVAWASERKDVLSAFFFMLTLWTYIRYSESRGGKSTMSPEVGFGNLGLLFLSLVCFALGLMSKPMLVTVPFVLLLLDYWPLERLPDNKTFIRGVNRLLLIEKVPFLILAIIASIVTVMVQSRQGAVAAKGLTILSRSANAMLSYSGYLEKTFWPTKLGAFYPHPATVKPELFDWFGWHMGISILLVILLSVIILRFTGGKRYFLVGWFWYIGMLVPVIGFIQVGAQGMADRYTYLPLIGIFIMVTWGVSDLIPTRHLKWSLGVPSAAGFTILGLLTFAQAERWQSSLVLFKHTLAVTTDNATAHFNFGAALEAKGDLPSAITHYQECLRIDPSNPDAHYNLGHVFANQGKLIEAEQEYQAALEIKPDHAPAHNNLGNIFLAQGKPDDALAEYSKAVRIEPDSAIAHNNMGKILVDQGRFGESESHFSKALKLKPDYPEARSGLALCLAAQGRYEESLSQWMEVVKQRTNNAEVHFNLANVLTELRRSDEARLEYASALRLQPDLFNKNLELGKSLAGSGQLEAARAKFIAATRLAPNDAEAHERLALVLARQGKIEEAISEFKEVVRLRPDAIAHYHIGLAQVMAGRFTEAIAAYREALRLNPEFPDALNDLAWILATHPQENFRNGSEAVQLAERAFELRHEARYCGTLDAAYAEAGRFDEAIVNANKTRDLALAAGQAEIAEAAEKRLTMYRSGKPFRQTPVSPNEGGGSR